MDKFKKTNIIDGMPNELILEQLFDSPLKVRLLKLFLRNSGGGFSLTEIRRRARANGSGLTRELQKLLKIGFLKTKTVAERTGGNSRAGRGVKRRSKNRGAAKKVKAYFVNRGFPLYNELNNLVLKLLPVSKEKMLQKIKAISGVKLVLLSGVFINSDKNRADLLIVGDNMSRKKLNNFLQDLEADVGKPINYAIMSKKEFYYRHDMYDRFIHDMLEYPHEKLINKLKI